MKKILTAVITAAIFTSFLFSFHSCALSTDMVYSANVTYVDKSYQGYPYYFVTDDSVQMLPSNISSFTISEDNGRKMAITFKTQETDLTKNPLSIELTGYSTTYQQNAILSDQPDTLGTDPAGLYLVNDVTPYMYKTGGIYEAPLNLNIAFNYSTSNSGATHLISMSYTSNPVDADGYYHLKFSHDANGDPSTSESSATFAFLLPSDTYASGVNGIILDFDGMGDDTQVPESWKLTYATGVVVRVAE